MKTNIIKMLNRSAIFALFVVVPLCFLLAYLLFGTPGISVYIKVYFGSGCVVAFILFHIKKARSVRSVYPINGSVDENYEFYFREFSEAGFKIEEFEPMDGRKMTVFFDHPGGLFFILTGVILLFAGIFPGLIWFISGRDRLSLTFIKGSSGYVHYIFESNNKNYAGEIWSKINMKHTQELVGPTPESLENLETKVRIV